jgi:Flp pilus assembly protein TadD
VRGQLDEAVTEIKRALELDPLSLIMNMCLGELYYCRHEYDQAIQQLRKTLELDPNYAVARLGLGRCYRQKGMFKEAIAEFQKARALYGDNPYGLGELGNAYALSGEKTKASEALANLEDLSKKEFSLNYDIAFLYCGLGNKDQAFEWLERAYQEKAGGMEYIKVDPAWDSFRSDPRFHSLLKRMNLE